VLAPCEVLDVVRKGICCLCGWNPPPIQPKKCRLNFKEADLIVVTMENTQSQVRIQFDLLDLLTTKKGLRHGDSLACLLFNLALENVVRNAGIQMSGTHHHHVPEGLGVFPFP